ncbi:MAG: hypothetical protein Q8M76_15655, partial [Spirochaetaceae bacterium]|nr:hypothetical protein [Spirochaetaceae bacterium]
MLLELGAPDFGLVASLMDVFPFHRGHFGSVIRRANPGRIFVDDPGAPSRALLWPSDGFQYLAVSGAEAARVGAALQAFLEDCHDILAREGGGGCIELVVAQAALESRIAAAFGGLPFIAVARLAFEPPAAPVRRAKRAPGPGAR